MACLPKWDDSGRGCGVWESTWEERNLSQENSKFQVHGILWGVKNSLGSWQKENSKVGRWEKEHGSMPEVKSRHAQRVSREKTFPVSILLQSKSQGALGRMSARPSGLLGQSEEAPLRSCDFLPPRHPFTSGHKIFKEQPGVDPFTCG